MVNGMAYAAMPSTTGLVRRFIAFSLCIAWVMFVSFTVPAHPLETAIPGVLVAAIPENLPPTYYRDPQTGRAGGFAVEVMNRVAQRAGLRVEYVFASDWGALQKILLEGKADIIPNMIINDTRKGLFLFTEPVETVSLNFFTRASDPADRPMAGKLVAVIKGSNSEDFLKHHPELTVCRYNNLDESILSLLSGHTDLLLAPTPNIKKLTAEAGLSHRLRMLEPTVMESMRAMAIRKDNPLLKRRLDAIIREFTLSPEYKRIYAKWWGEPQSWWTVTRVVYLAIALLLVIVIALTLWRYRSILVLSGQVTQKRQELELYFNSALDLLCVCDISGYFRRVNPEWSRATGYSLEELTDSPVVNFVHPDDQDATVSAVAELGRGQNVLGFVNRMRHRDGSYRWIEWRAYPRDNMIYAVARDITKRKRIELENEQRTREFAALNRIAIDVYATLSVQEASAAMIRGITDSIAPDLAFLMLREGDEFVIQEAQPPEAQRTFRDTPIHHAGECLCGLAVQEGNAIFSTDIREDVRCTREECKNAGFLSFAAIPICGSDAPIGIIGIASTTLRDFRSHGAFLTAVANHVASALMNAQLYEKAVRAEAAYRESEMQFRSLFEHMTEGVALHELVLDAAGNPVDYRMVSVNPRFYQILDMNEAQVIGKYASEVFNQTPAPFLEEYAHVATSGIPLRFEKELSSRHAFFEISVVPWKQDGFATIFTDTTERVHNAKKIVQQTQLLYNTHDYIGMVTLDGVSLYHNPAAYELLGYAPESGQELTIERAHLPEDLTMIREVVLPMAIRNGVWHGENRLVHRDGHLIPVDQTVFPVRDSSGEIYALATIMRDMTQQKQAEATFKEQQNLISDIVETSQDWIWEIRKDGTHIFTNNAVQQILGYSPSEICHKDIFSLIHPDDLPGVHALLADCVRNRQGWHNLVLRWYHSNGSIRHLESNSLPVFNAQSELVGFRGVDRDITTRLEMEDRLRQSEKMEAIGQLAGGVAHDFNNQLGGIMVLADMLREHVTQPPLAGYVENILKACQHAADLTQQLLAFSRKGKYLSKPVDLHALIQETTAILSRSLDKRIHINHYLDAPNPVVLGDPSQLQNALLNLAVNARDAMPSGGELTFSTREIELEDRAFDSELLAGTYIEVSVCDTGVGMNNEVKAHVFEPFFTTKDIGKGTGLGLAAVFGTVKSHHGAIHCYSEVGKGSVFRMYLKAQEGTLTLPSAQPEQTNEDLTGVRVLVIDDEPIILRAVTFMLNESGCIVHAYDEAEKAMEFFRTSWREIDVVILDMIMPLKGGRELYPQMRSINPDTRVLLSSGYSLNGEAQGILDMGVGDFIKKPFRPSELATKISSLIRK